MPTATVSPSALADWLIARGRHFVTTEEVAELVGVEPNVVSVSLQRAREANKIVSVTKGGWVPVPPEYRDAGAPPPLHYVDPLMRHLGHPYYVGLLSAARLHGASHQVPMVLQVVTPALLRDRRIGSNRLEFIRRSSAGRRPTVQRNVPTGRITVATPEVTVLDLVEAPSSGAGLGNVATVIGDLLKEGAIDPGALAAIAESYPTAVAQRTGYLVERMADEVGASIQLDRLEQLVADATYTVLDPQRPREGEHDRRWRVIVNTDIEHDL
ncbi:MAG TPA: type IV toxin-antitoxin system AbiEi family antitoxin [Acidimicrobiales bacterium]